MKWLFGLFENKLSLYDVLTVPAISYWAGEFSLWLLLLLIPNVILSAIMTNRAEDAKN
jgi:hypothetical protein